VLDYEPALTRPYRVRLEDGEILEANAVVLTAPSFAAADLVERFQPELAAGLRAHSLCHYRHGLTGLCQARDWRAAGWLRLVIHAPSAAGINAVHG